MSSLHSALALFQPAAGVSSNVRRPADELISHIARTGPALEAAHVLKELPIDQWGNHNGVTGGALAIFKFSEISEALRNFGGVEIAQGGVLRIVFSILR
jgi:hypothetical protein